MYLAFGRVGDQIAAAIVGDHFFDVARGQIGGFRDHPHAGFGPLVLETTPPMSLDPILMEVLVCAVR